jgi:mono/diheme cytochrome c family protein
MRRLLDPSTLVLAAVLAACAGEPEKADRAARETPAASPEPVDERGKFQQKAAEPPPIEAKVVEPPPEEKAEIVETPPPTKKPGPKPDLAAGKTLFLAKCKACHGEDGTGNPKVKEKYDVPSLVGSKDSLAHVEKVIRKGVADTKMKGYEGKLSDAEIDAVAAYVAAL